MDPPLCVQNAMMTKDKKPFTYTPGGIDLSEVRSPRMARRIERNAHLGGSGDVQRPPQTQQPQNYNNLPPSTLAAMRPQPQVQVFPSGPPPPPPMKGRVVPPPPPPMNAPPPPPPPPSGPLPTQKVKTSDNQVLERPDMTKIIPEDPMKLLRKTGGPQPRKTMVDQLFEETTGGVRSGPRSPPTPPQKASQYEQESRQQPALIDRGAPISPVPQQQYQPPSPPYRPQTQQYQPQTPQNRNSAQNYQHQTSQYQPQPPQSPPEVSRYQPPVIERQPSMRAQNNEPELKTSTAHLGSLYIPPPNQQQQRKITSPPSPPERNTDSPNLQTPPLKEAPKPWQSKKQQQEEIPAWAKRDTQQEEKSPSPQVQQQPQQRGWPQSQPAQYSPSYNNNQQVPIPAQNQQPIGVRIEIRTNYPQYEEPEETNPNAVYVTQPMVFQHPGPRVSAEPKQKPKPKVDNQGVKVIPVQYEGGPGTPNSERSLKRQQSWGSNPTQSNSFKVIQKLTQTKNDDEEEDFNAPMKEYPPTFPQNFQQSADQLGRMKIGDGDHNMMNRFNQEFYFYDEENPRYRGGHIPSKVFRILDRSVPRGPSVQNNPGPKVRTIPIRLEDDDSPKPYVHPSQQTVPEPKKYTGSSIPSRSFKILQAMTAPENYASADEENDATLYDQWGFGRYYPPYPPPPYWHDYYHNYYYPDPNSEFSKEEADRSFKSAQRQTQTSRPNSLSGRLTPNSSTGRQTPVLGRRTPTQGLNPASTGRTTPTSRPSYTPRPSPIPFWGFMPPPYPHPIPKKYTTTDESDSECNSRSTPTNVWGYQYHPSEESENENFEAGGCPPYPYFDPYYYYYHGYPPVYPPYHYYQMSDSEENPGYSSMDEMTFYNKSSRNNSNSSISSSTKSQVTPTLNLKEQVINIKVTEPESDRDNESSEAEEDTISKQPEEVKPSLKSIKSVSNINIYYDEENETDDEDSSEENSEGTNEEFEDDESEMAEDGYPHQLSVIFEESERTESRLRSSSVMSDATTIANKSEDEEESCQQTLKLTSVIAEEIDEYNKKTDTTETEIYASFTLKKSSPTSKKIAPSESDNEADKSNYVANDEENEKDLIVNIDPGTNHDPVDEGKESDDSEDWWGILGGEDDLPKPRVKNNDIEMIDKKEDNQNIEESTDTVDEKPKQTTTNIDTIDVKEEEIRTENKFYEDPLDIKYKTIEESTKYELEEESKTEDKLDIELDNIDSKKRSIYDDSDEDENTGKLIEMGSFMAQLEQIQKEAGLWKADLNLMSEKQTRYNETSKRSKHGSQIEITHSIQNGNIQDCLENTEKLNVCSVMNKDSNKINVPCYKKEESFESGYSASYTDYSYSSSKSESESLPAKEPSIKDIPKLNSRHNKLEKLTRQAVIDKVDMDESSDDTESSSDDERDKINDENNNENEVKVLSIKERIQSLRECIKQKQTKCQDQEIKTSVKDKITALETNNPNRSKTTSTKSSLKSFEDDSEEEDFDSGVTSDMSRHISDNEEFPELRKLTKYQRAATHSRLYKLLQEECDSDNEEEHTNNESKKNQSTNGEAPRRDRLTLPLNKSPERYSPCSSGISSPNSSVNEKLVGELVHSLLKRKKGQMFRNIPKEKLYAAATKILQEDFEDIDIQEDCSSFLSPLKCSTGYSTAAQTPQEFNGNFDEYSQYYDTWKEAERLYDENYDVLPSKAFKELRKTGSIAGFLAKCPRVLSSKNIHKKLMKLLENSESSPHVLEKPLDTNEVTTAS